MTCCRRFGLRHVVHTPCNAIVQATNGEMSMSNPALFQPKAPLLPIGLVVAFATAVAQLGLGFVGQVLQRAGSQHVQYAAGGLAHAIGGVTMTFTPRDFSSGSSTIAGLCASMTTATVFGQRCAIQSAAHAVPCRFVSRYSASSMCAVPSEYFMHAPIANALRSGDMSMPNEVTPPSARASTVPVAG